MDTYKEIFAGKKITMIGLGVLGRGIGDAAFLAEMGADLIVTDLKTEAQLADALNELAAYDNITYVLGEHREIDFIDRDYILVGPSVPLDSPYVAAAKKAGGTCKQSAAWFAELSQVPIIGVTGTRGKSTVTNMIHHVLSVVTGEEILLGGNVRGVSNLQLLKQVKEDSLCVMELDSWQLQGWGWSQMSPQIAVFTNFMEDHQNYYRPVSERMSQVGLAPSERMQTASSALGAMDLYFNDKAQIFLHQDEGGVFITTPEVFERVKTLPGTSLGQEVVLVDASVIPEDCLLSMPGEHNRLNAALAVEALKALSLGEEEIFAALATFAGVPGRLQLVTTSNNVRVYNDNNATTPQATIAALRALDIGNKNIILIAGGADKGIPLTSLGQAVTEHCKQVILLPGTGTNMLVELLSEEPLLAETLEAAVEIAQAAAENGDIILFSPAFASFGMFKNEYERNDEFEQVVEKLIS